MIDGLVAQYLFNGNADDTSGHGHHGAVHGATLAPDRFGNPNRAYRFDGRDDYIVVSPPPALTSDALSVSVWVYYEPRSFIGWTNCIVCQDDGNDEDQSRRVFQLSTFDNHIVWHRMIRARDPVYKRVIRSRSWYHVAAVYEGGAHLLYVDGVRRDAVAHELWTHADEPLYMGRKGTPEPSFYLRGCIDDVRLYNRPLSAPDVLELFHEGGFEKAPPPPVGELEDPISGKWGERGIMFLDLAFDGRSRVRGTVMSGRPDHRVPIAAGSFDRMTGALQLSGEARRPDTGSLAPYLVDGMLSDRQLTVKATFGPYDGNHTFTQAGARRSWWERVWRFLTVHG